MQRNNNFKTHYNMTQYKEQKNKKIRGNIYVPILSQYDTKEFPNNAKMHKDRVKYITA